MEIVDANVVLRYLLKDHEIFYPKSKQIIEQKQIYIPTEVVAEIVYVLEKVYEVPKSEISRGLCRTRDFVIVQGQSDIETGAYLLYVRILMSR